MNPIDSSNPLFASVLPDSFRSTSTVMTCPTTTQTHVEPLKNIPLLPKNALKIIFDQLALHDRNTCRLACKAWNLIIKESSWYETLVQKWQTCFKEELQQPKFSSLNQLGQLCIGRPFLKEYFNMCCEKKNAKGIIALSENPFFQEEVNFDYAFQTVCSIGLIEVVHFFLNHKQVTEYADNCKAIELAAVNGHINCLQILLDNRYAIIGLERNPNIIYATCEANQVEAVRILLKHKSIDPAFKNNRLIQKACEKGFEDMVRLLLMDERVNPTDQKNLAFQLTCRHGHYSIANQLLENSRVDPSDQNNQAFKFACEHGHLHIVMLLLKDIRVNVSDTHNQALYLACENKQKKIVEILLKHKSVDPVDCFSPVSQKPVNLIKEAMNKGALDIVELLLKDRRVDASFEACELLKMAIQADYLEIIRLLIHDKIAQKNLNRKDLLTYVSRKGDRELLALLLEYQLISSPEEFKQAVFIATQYGHEQFVSNLINAIEIDSTKWLLSPTQKQINPLQEACQQGNIKIAKRLLAETRVDFLFIDAQSLNQALQTSILQNHKDIIELLLADQRMKSSVDFKELYNLVFANGRHDIAAFLFEFSYVPREKFSLIFQLACAHEHLQTMQLIIENDANNLLEKDYKLAIRQASEYGFFSIVEFIVNQKAKVLSTRHRKAIQLAKKNNNHEIVEFLKQQRK